MRGGAEGWWSVGRVWGEAGDACGDVEGCDEVGHGGGNRGADGDHQTKERESGWSGLWNAVHGSKGHTTVT